MARQAQTFLRGANVLFSVVRSQQGEFSRWVTFNLTVKRLGFGSRRSYV